MYIMNNKGLKIDPWWTPHFIVPQLDIDYCCWIRSIISTFCFLSNRWDSNHWQSTPHIQQQNNTPRRILSNALAKLQKIPPLSLQWF